MHAELENAERTLDVKLDNIREATRVTATTLEVAREAVQDSLFNQLGAVQAEVDNGVDIYAFGSIGRAEMGHFGDFDYLVVVNRIDVSVKTIRQFRQAAIDAYPPLNIEPPGSSGLFGGVIAAPNLVNVIGLNDDSNLNMSQRILILQEGIALNPHNDREIVVEAILNRYLFDYEGHGESPLVPRFLLNDVVRFWRTVAVDYQAKRWHEVQGSREDADKPSARKKKWGLRYIKLRSSRKWSFAGNLVSVFWPVLSGRNTTVDLLSGQFDMPPLARIAQLSQAYKSEGPTLRDLREVLELCDWFIGRLSEGDWRDAITVIDDPTSPNKGAVFESAQKKTSELQCALQRLFFSDESPTTGSKVTLGQLSRKYLSF